MLLNHNLLCKSETVNCLCLEVLGQVRSEDLALAKT